MATAGPLTLQEQIELEEDRGASVSEGYTDVCCDSCGKRFLLNDEVFLATVWQMIQQGPGYEAHFVLDENGDFISSPLLFHFECWEEIVEELREVTEDLPPLNGYQDSVLPCTLCRSDILEWEYFVRVNIGEMRRSPRQPNGTSEYRFTRVDHNPGTVVCMSCVAHINEDVLEIWCDLSQDGECNTCAHDRCWRYNDNSCDCDCHKEE